MHTRTHTPIHTLTRVCSQLPPAVYQRGRRLGAPVRSSAGPPGAHDFLSQSRSFGDASNAARKQPMAICVSARHCACCFNCPRQNRKGGRQAPKFGIGASVTHCEEQGWHLGWALAGCQGMSGRIAARSQCPAHCWVEPRHCKGATQGWQPTELVRCAEGWRRPYAAHPSQCRQQQTTREVSPSAAAVG